MITHATQRESDFILVTLRIGLGSIQRRLMPPNKNKDEEEEDEEEEDEEEEDEEEDKEEEESMRRWM